MFSDVHAAGEHDLIVFAACGQQTLRGFFNSLKGLHLLWCRRFFYVPASFIFFSSGRTTSRAITMARKSAVGPA